MREATDLRQEYASMLMSVGEEVSKSKTSPCGVLTLVFYTNGESKSSLMCEEFVGIDRVIGSMEIVKNGLISSKPSSPA